MAPAYEYLDRRVLAALSFVDAAGAPVVSPVAVEADGVRILRKASGLAVVTAAPGLAAHAAAFDAPPTTPALGSVVLQLDLRPSERRLAARRFALKLPRTSATANMSSPDSLFRPVEVALLPSPCASPTGLAAALSVTVRRADDQRRVEGALVRLRPAGGLPQARAVTDAAGDAVLLVPAAPVRSDGPGGAALPDLAADLDVIVDPALARFTADADLAAARLMPRGGPLIDPDDLETRLAAGAQAQAGIRIAAGETRTAAVSWTPP